MKTSFLLLISFFFVSFSLKAQTVNGIPLKDYKEEYLKWSAKSAGLGSRKIQVLIDFGQEARVLSNMEQILLDSTGKKMEFNSSIDVLNFMFKNGYELMQPFGTEYISFYMRKIKTP
ncbi:MAG: hypothetical protein ABIN48_06480 [Ginsengibacter sp.]